MTKSNREDVYRVIDGERYYQELMAKKHNWGQGTGDASNHEVGVFLALLETYVRRALDAHADATGYRGPVSDNQALHVVRKIAALAVACMEQHGAPERKIDGE